MIDPKDRIHDMKHLKTKVFISAFLIVLIGFLPVLINTGGRYLYSGDYNAQNMPYIKYLAEKWRTGFPQWDWTADLGGNFISSYTFYGLFSPFVLVCSLFPKSMIWYVLSAVNFSVIALAGVTACLYIRQYVKKDSTAYMCSLLYAFSGYQLYTLSFMFSDTIALFPLLLFAFDRLIHQRKSLLFAVILAVCGIVNYFYFFGECVFLLIYFIIKLVKKEFKLDVKLFVKIAFETLLGVVLTAAVLLPNFFSIINNGHASQTIFDKNLLAYDMPVIWKTVQSVFMAPDFVAVPSLFTGYDINVGSVSLFIPMFMFIGVISIIRSNRKKWYSLLITVCAIMVSVPLLNSAFSAFNAQFYARWFYMPVLILIMMTGLYLEEFEERDIKLELKIHIFFIALFAAYGLFFVIRRRNINEAEPFYFWLNMLYSALSVGTVYLMRYKGDQSFVSPKNIKKIVVVFTALPLLCNTGNLLMRSMGWYIPMSIETVYNYDTDVVIDDDTAFRCVMKYDDCNDIAVTWGYPQIDTFNSMVPSSTTDFFSYAGITRHQNILSDEQIYPLCSLLSTKYQIFSNPQHMGVVVEPEYILKYMETFEYVELFGAYAVFENPNYIPMGYCYDNYIDEELFKPKELTGTDMGDLIRSVSGETDGYTSYEKQLLMLKAMPLSAEQIEKYGDILQPIPDEKKDDLTEEAYVKDCADRRDTAAYEFTPNDKGFTAKIDMARKNLVFFSVPYDKAFTAYVDGAETEIEKVFGGLCAVLVPEGDHEISFEYTVLGLKEGIIIICAAVGVLAVYAVGVMAMYFGKSSKSKKKSSKKA